MKTPRIGWWFAALVVIVAARAWPSASDGRFALVADEIVDARTGLVWAKTDSGKNVLWNDRSCPAGYRVPTAEELFSLVDDRATLGTPLADPLLGLTAHWYWTSTTKVTSPFKYAWWVDFSKGMKVQADITLRADVRCVR